MKKNSPKLNDRGKDFLKSMCFLSPSLLGVGIFFILPFCVVVYYSLIDGVGSKNFVFLQNFIKLFDNSAFRLAAKNTLTFSAMAVPLAVVLSMVLALMLESRIPLKSQFRTFFLSPMMVPVASVVLIWQVLFNYNGTVNEFLMLFGADKVDWLQSQFAPVVVLLLFLWKNLGYNMILFMAALNNIPKELLEVADVEGASEMYKFFAIKLRYLSPTVLFVTILSLINSFKVFREVYLLAGAYPYEALYTLQHFMNNTFDSLDYQKLSAAAVLMALVMVVIIALLFKAEDWFGKDVEG
ncbi:MAG: sugar ABC transporter permease [Candidatus Limivicinus sp.]|nr:sugar ABC transporter permease [Clostridiales bacterium]MCI7137262.1 sugar ABC transporter permease [Clostridiales bacterium]MDY6133685.1 sugar ABC transporter permease [Candidatus Limivicinus sp.]